MTLEDEAVVVFVAIGIVSVDLYDFGDKTPTRAAFKVYDHVHRIADVGFNRTVGQVHAALQNAANESGETLFCGCGVDGRKTARVPGVEKLQEIEGLAGSNFTELRDGYACGWCELKDGQLILVPHITSPQPIRRFAHLDEAEIIGRVTGVAMRIVGGGLTQLADLRAARHGGTAEE